LSKVFLRYRLTDVKQRWERDENIPNIYRKGQIS
jgi:hypothetical protein